jgi:CDP-diacylglycerol--glycerol-3-phosphate 3-phosphatidyltransferase
MTLANKITLLRLALIPVFTLLIMIYTREQPWVRYAALSVYIVAALSDALDGFVARAYNQKTKLGAVLDPLADKLMINTGFVFMAVNHEFAFTIPMWFPVIVLLRDLIIVIGAFLINEFFGPVRVKPSIFGKLTTVIQMALVISILLEAPIARTLMYVALVLVGLSFVDYFRAGVKQVGNEDEA